MKKLNNVNVYELINKGFDNLTVEEKMLLALKGAINSYKENPTEEFWEEFITTTYENLKNDYGWTW